MRKIKLICLSVVAIVISLVLSSCTGDNGGGNGLEKTGIVLHADKNTVRADGTDRIVFRVEVDGVDVSSSGASVCYESETSSMCLPVKEGKFVFVTETPGKYMFVAHYGELTSDEMEINAE